MASPERRTGVVEKYQNLNKLTRNGAIILGVGFAAVGYPNLAMIAFTAAAFDQGQIMVIDSFKKKHTS